jgi:hypothetical protein
MSIIKNTTDTGKERDVEKEPLLTDCGNVISHYGNQYAGSSKKLK